MRYCGPFIDHAERAISELREKGALRRKIEEMLAMRGDSQVERYLLRSETIPQEEKIFFEEHTHWIQKGKAGVPVELGVPVCIIENQYQFILDHKILWKGIAVDP